jgi:hypothetical protein
LMLKEWFSSKDWGLVSSPSKWNEPNDKWDLAIVYLPAQAENNLSQFWRVVEKGDYLYKIKVKPSTLMWYGSWSWVSDYSQLEVNQTVKGTAWQTWVNLPSFLVQYILWRGGF